MLNALLYAFFFVAFFITVECIKRWQNYAPEQTRKVVHIGSSLITASMAFWSDRKVITLLAILFMLLLWFTRNNKWFTSLQGVRRMTIGEFTFALSTIPAAWVFLPGHPEAFAFGFLILGVSDTSAQWFGNRYPVRRIIVFKQLKSLGGSLAFFIVSLVITLMALTYLDIMLAANQVLIMMGCILALTAMEGLLTYGLDNAIIPLVAGWILTILMGS